MKFIRIILLLFAWPALLIGLGALLFFDDWLSKLTTFFILLLLTWFLCWKKAVLKKIKWPLLITFLATFIGIVALFPSRKSDPEAQAQSIFINKNGERISYPLLPYLLSGITESDQVKTGIALGQLVPTSSNPNLVADIKKQPISNNIFLEEYQLRKNNKRFDGVGNVFPFQAFQTAGLYSDISHYYLIKPEVTNANTPVVVFLHGFMGNFEMYHSYLSQLGDAIVICPSTKSITGIWSTNDLDLIIDTILLQLNKQFPGNFDNPHLMGLSNGGTGMNAALRHRYGAFKTYTYISTWMKVVPKKVDSSVKIYTIYGTADAAARGNPAMVKTLQTKQHHIEQFPFSNEGHYVLLSQKESIQGILKKIIAR